MARGGCPLTGQPFVPRADTIAPTCSASLPLTDGIAYVSRSATGLAGLLLYRRAWVLSIAGRVASNGSSASVFAVTYLLMSRPHWPALRLDRRAAALIGAVLMVAVDVLNPDQAYRAIG